MRRASFIRWSLVAVVAGLALGRGEGAQAQMFGLRSLGQGLSQGPLPGNQLPASPVPTAGTAGIPPGMTTSGGAGMAGGAMGNARFVRNNRNAASFVGTDAREQRGFVGSQQAQEGTSTQLNGLPPATTSPDVNRPLVEPTTRRPSLYRPRLTVDFDYHLPPDSVRKTTVERRLARSLGDRALGPIEVLVEGRVATLLGAVASQRDRALAAELLQLEPGISRVENRLTVAPELPAPPAAPAFLPTTPPSPQ